MYRSFGQGAPPESMVFILFAELSPFLGRGLKILNSSPPGDLSEAYFNTFGDSYTLFIFVYSVLKIFFYMFYVFFILYHGFLMIFAIQDDSFAFSILFDCS